MARRGPHPTRERLIEAMVALLDEKGAEHISVDEVLTTSGISKGSLYHHFEDFGDLLEEAYIRRFSVTATQFVAGIENAVSVVNSREDFTKAIVEVTKASNAPDRASFRRERIRAMALAAESERFSKRLAREQERLTETYTDLVREAQNKGYVSSETKPQVIAVFIQAYTFGRVIDDIAETHVDPDEWTSFITRVVDGF